jgi:hypothetical protein
VLDGLAWSAPALGDGWLVLVNAGRQQELFRLRGERLERLDLGGTPPWIHAVAGFEAGVGAVVSDARGPRLRRFALP